MSDWLRDISIILALLALAAFFTISKTALTAASRARMLERERRGDTRAGLAQHLTGMRHRLLGAILFGRTVVTIAASAVAIAMLTASAGQGA